MVCVVFNAAALREAYARSFRTSMFPNGNVFSCKTCHATDFGGPRNPFGLDVQKLVPSGSSQSFWSAALAALDSDGDGVSNGVELGDPAGTWKQGNPNPAGMPKITNPGDPKSVAEIIPTSPADSWVAVLSGQSVVPPVNTMARGTAVFLLHEPEKKIIYYLNLFEIQNVSAAHIYLGESSENGGIVYTLETSITGASSKTLNVTESDIANLKAGRFYVQVHTQQNPSGEMRGQIEDQPLRFYAVLDSSQVTGNASASTGKGIMDITISENTAKMSYQLTVSGLTGITAAHIHKGIRGENGSVIIPIASAAFTEISGEAEVTTDILSDLLAERLYVNIHTEQNPNGEIRGQIIFGVPKDIPTSIANWMMHD